MRGILLFVAFLVVSAYSNPVSEKKGCTTESGCPNNLLCHMSECVDPCADGICGSNASCKIERNTGVCSCLEGFYGNPYVECRPEEDLKVTTEELPREVPCNGICGGANTRCTLRKENIILCTCLEGMTGDPFDFCSPIDA